MRRYSALAGRLRRFAGSKFGIALGGAFLLYTLTGFLLAPWLLQRELPRYFEQQFGTKATLESAHVNPLSLQVDLRGFKLAESGRPVAIEAGLIRVNLEWSSLPRFAWTFSEIRIERPVIHAELDADETLNLARLFAPRTTTPSPRTKESKPPRLLIEHLSISGGALAFTDHTLAPAATTRFDPVAFDIHDISTLPDHRGEHRLTARLPGGGNLLWEGRLSLAPLESSARLTLNDGRFSTIWNFLRDQLAIAEPEGSYSLSLHYQMAYAGGKPALSVNELAIGIRNLVIVRPGPGEPLLRLGSLSLEDGRFELESRTLAFNNVRIADAAIAVALDDEGIPDWARLTKAAAGKKPSPAAPPQNEGETQPTMAAAAQPWHIRLPQIAVGPLSLAYTDRSRIAPLRATASAIEARLGLDLKLGNALQVQVENLSTKTGVIALQPVSAKEPLLSLQEATVSELQYNLQEQRLHLEQVRLAGGNTRITREADGRLALLDLFTARKPAPAQPSALKTTVGRFDIAGHNLAVADQGFQPALAYDLDQINVQLSQLSWPAQGPGTLDLALRVKQGGSFQAKGTFDIGRETADLRVELAALALTPLDALLKRDTTLTLASGTLEAAGRVLWNGKQSPGAVRYTGTAGSKTLELRVAADGERLLGLQELAATGIDADLGANRIAVAHIGLKQPYARLRIHKDKTTNFAAVRRAPATAASPDAAAAAGSGTSPAPAAVATPLAIHVDRVSVEDGSMDFSDQSLVLPFATFIKSLGGAVNGLSSTPDSRASLKFEGGIADFGLARAEGTIQPFAPKKFTDIAVVFRNVDLPPMTPYTATFAGRRIASGKLSLDLQYTIENSKLAGANKLLLEKFTLGERVDSPSAVNLPLDLAIALLTDSEGRIDLAVPVSGDVDNPDFSYGHIVWQAIRTVITRIVTAPFRALAALFGGGETLGDIVFDPGSARLLPTEIEKLQRVTEGLKKRPQLKLAVQGQFHAGEDGKALRARAVRADLAAREGLKLPSGKDPGPIGFDNPKTQRALELMLEARSDSAAQFAEAYRKTAGRDAARVNAALALVGRGTGDRALYVALHQRLVELQPLPESSLHQLAAARAAAIADALTKKLQLDAARISGKPPVAAEEAAANGVPAKLSFDAQAQ